VISYGSAAETTLPLTDQFQTDAPDRIAKIECVGATNTGDALEVAQRELAKHDDPEAINAVILFTDGIPNVLTANWPVKALASECRDGSRDRRPPCGAQLGICGEGPSRVLAGTLTEDGFFVPPNLSQADELRRDYLKNRSANSCFGRYAITNLAYIPEQDWRGGSVTASRPVERYKAGLYAGKIRIDSRDTVRNAIANQVENAARRIRSGPPNPAFLYVVGFKNPTAPDAVESLGSLQSLANDPAASSFDARQPA